MESPGEMAVVMRRAAARVVPELELITQAVLERALVIAREKIGSMQPGWDPFAESTEWRVGRVGPLERTGDLRESFHIRRAGTRGELASDSPYIQYSELGTSHEPPRPLMMDCMRQAMRELGYSRLRFALVRVIR